MRQILSEITVGLRTEADLSCFDRFVSYLFLKLLLGQYMAVLKQFTSLVEPYFMRHCVAQATLTRLPDLPGATSLVVGYYQSQPWLTARATSSFIVAVSESAMSGKFY